MTQVVKRYPEWRTERIDLNEIKYEKLSEVIRILTETKERYGDLDIDFDNDEYSLDIYANYLRPETEQEKQGRLHYEEQSKEYRRKQYEQLKKEFENS